MTKYLTGSSDSSTSEESENEDWGEAPLTISPRTVEQENIEPGPSNAFKAAEILGVDPLTIKSLGSEIHQEIANRWRDFLKNDIEKTDRKELIEKYPVPANVPALNAPKVNPDLQGCLNEVSTKPQNRIPSYQKSKISWGQPLAPFQYQWTVFSRPQPRKLMNT